MIPAEATPQNTDWNRFLGTAPKRAWDPHRYFQWRLYWDYSGGISTDLLVHQTDIVNFMLDKTVPKSCMASGGIYRWTDKTDDRDVPDTLSAIYDYSDKMQLNYSCYLGNEFFGYGEEICGNEGTIRVMNRQDLYFEPETYNSRRANAPNRAPEAIKARAAIHINGPQEYKESDGAINHFRNFIQSVLGKEQPIAPPPVGQQAAISGHMATLSLQEPEESRLGRSREKSPLRLDRGAHLMAAVATAPAGTSPRWIVSRSVDLSLVIGSVLAGYLYLGLYTALHVKITLLWWFWSVGFDGTHIFATASRTYFDKEARARNPKLLYGSLLVFFSLGPLMVLAGQKGLLALLVGVWAYYHVIRQHYGFLVLYKVKNRDLLPLDNTLDRVFLGVMMIFPPFHRFFIHHPEELGHQAGVPAVRAGLLGDRRHHGRGLAGAPGGPLPPRRAQVPAARRRSSRCTG